MDDINNKNLILVDKDGNYKGLGNINNQDEHHIDSLINYALFVYPTINFKSENKSETFHKIIYCLIADDKAVYLHSQGYGLLFMPKNHTDSQINALKNVFKKLDKTYIYVNYNLKLNKNNNLSGDLTMYRENELALDEYLNAKAKDKIQKRL